MIPEKDTATTSSIESKGRIPEPTRQQGAKNRKVQGSKGYQSKGKGMGQEMMPLVRGKLSARTLANMKSKGFTFRFSILANVYSASDEDNYLNF